ncbi:MAG: hypothetical protein R2847_03465 [Bacteroidia bacterium]
MYQAEHLHILISGVHRQELQAHPIQYSCRYIYSNCTDINGCSATSKDTLFNPPLLVISHSSTNASCALNNGDTIFNL